MTAATIPEIHQATPGAEWKRPERTRKEERVTSVSFSLLREEERGRELTNEGEDDSSDVSEGANESWGQEKGRE